MRTVWKFPIFVVPPTTQLKLPKGAILRHVGIQGSDPCVWYEVDDEQPVDYRIISIFGTGHPIPADGQYLGTCQQYGYVWHLYEFKED